jgi:diguanylate cyclase (GGDEF)-like protein
MSSRPPQDDLEQTRVANLGEMQKELAARSRQRPCLLVLHGSNVGELFRLDEGETYLGRGSTATIRLNDDGVSRKHCRVMQRQGVVMIEDLGSSNGTVINGDHVATKELREGDKIQLGSTTILKFTYQDHLDETFHQTMTDAALRDGLTRAFNKKYFLDRLETEIAYAKRHRTPLSLIMFDADLFKRVNDTYGHLAGDYVLVRLSKLSMGTVRAEDVFARYGGEEFGVICRGVPLDSAGILAERLRVLVETTTFDHEGHRLPITISLGVAAYPDTPIETAPQLIAAADEALYEAKRTGRNRVLLKRG